MISCRGGIEYCQHISSYRQVKCKVNMSHPNNVNRAWSSSIKIKFEGTPQNCSAYTVGPTYSVGWGYQKSILRVGWGSLTVGWVWGYQNSILRAGWVPRRRWEELAQSSHKSSHRVKNPQKRCSSKTIRVIHWTVTSEWNTEVNWGKTGGQMQWEEFAEWKSVLSPFTVTNPPPIPRVQSPPEKWHLTERQ